MGDRVALLLLALATSALALEVRRKKKGFKPRSHRTRRGGAPPYKVNVYIYRRVPGACHPAAFGVNAFHATSGRLPPRRFRCERVPGDKRLNAFTPKAAGRRASIRSQRIDAFRAQCRVHTESGEAARLHTKSTYRRVPCAMPRSHRKRRGGAPQYKVNI